MDGKALESRDFGRFGSSVLRFADRRPGGKEDTGLAAAWADPLPEVCGRLMSNDAFGLGPNFTLGLLYCAYSSAYRSESSGRVVWEESRGSGPFSKSAS
jgi:hypothetical protein